MRSQRNPITRIGRYTLVLLVAVLFAPRSVHAQSFSAGDKVLGFGVGLGGAYANASAGTSESPAWGLSYEQGVTDLGPGVLGIGGYVGYKTLGASNGASFGGTAYTYDWRWNYVIIGVRGAWHYNEWHGNNKLDTYGWLMLNYNIVSFTDKTNYPSGSPIYGHNVPSSLGLSGFVGARYYFNDHFAANAELGYGVSVLTLGVSYKL